MNFAPLGIIEVAPSRQRQAFNETALNALAASIEAYGLLHPIVCARRVRVNGLPLLRLVAGERRLRAMTVLHAEHRSFTCDDAPVPLDLIPYILVSEASDTDAVTSDLRFREIELEENIQREDLTWQERVKALDELHTLRTIVNPGQSVSDTAAELAAGSSSISHSHARHVVARAQIIAQHLDDPEVAKASSVTDAFKIVAVKTSALFVTEMNRRGIGEQSRHDLIAGKLEIELPLLPADSFACIIADPPYGISADEFGDITTLAHNYDDNADAAAALALVIARETLRITHAEAHLYMFCDIELFIYLRDAINAIDEDGAAWKVWRTPLIWTKGQTGHAPAGTAGVRRAYELILWASKGGKGFSQVWSDVIEVPIVKDRLQAAQKPVELYKILLKRSCLPGDQVLDPCCGSGTIFPAATQANVKAVGIERDWDTAALAQLRMTE